jgi:hypothetical protein
MSKINSNHLLSLKKSYEDVGARTWDNQDFYLNNLEVSRNLFTSESLTSRTPIPKKFNVIALLSGLPFSLEFQNTVISIQKSMAEIIGNKLHYLVKPLNLGVEYCVFKWPDGNWQENWMEILKNQLDVFSFKSYNLSIEGVQINKDGCVILKGYDEKMSLFNIREYMKDKISFLPARQSNWAHIPIGRILEPIGYDNFNNLRDFIQKKSDHSFCVEKISNVKLVNEERWYMEEKEILKKVNLSD